MAKTQTQTQTRTQTKDRAQDQTQNPAPVPVPVPVPASDPAPVDVVDDIEYRCMELAQEYINALDDPNEIKKNNGLFVDMLKKIYKRYLIDILDNAHTNGNRYDFILLDKLFYIYSSLVYQYKQNKRCSILEFTLFVNISRDTLYNCITGKTKHLTPNESTMVKKWFTECENTLTNGSSVFEIFLLKSQYRYNDNLAPLPVQDQSPVMTFEDLPELEDKPKKKKTT